MAIGERELKKYQQLDHSLTHPIQILMGFLCKYKDWKTMAGITHWYGRQWQFTLLSFELILFASTITIIIRCRPNYRTKQTVYIYYYLNMQSKCIYFIYRSHLVLKLAKILLSLPVVMAILYSAYCCSLMWFKRKQVKRSFRSMFQWSNLSEHMLHPIVWYWSNHVCVCI